MDMFGTQTCGAVTIHTWNFRVIEQRVPMKNRTFGILTIYFCDMHVTYQREYFRVLRVGAVHVIFDIEIAAKFAVDHMISAAISLAGRTAQRATRCKTTLNLSSSIQTSFETWHTDVHVCLLHVDLISKQSNKNWLNFIKAMF